MSSFFVPGQPATKGSTRSFRHQHSGAIVTMADCKRLKAWTVLARNAALAAGVQQTTQPVGVVCFFYFERPKFHRGVRGLRPSAPRWHVVKPDVDKLARAVLDALTGIAYYDDSQVVDIICQKYFADANPEGAGVRINIVPKHEVPV